MLSFGNISIDEVKKLHNFQIHAHGNYVVITGKLVNGTDYYTFLATGPILKYILDDMNQRIVVGPLSRVQLGSIISTLKNIGCNFQQRYINNKLIFIPETKDIGSQTKLNFGDISIDELKKLHNFRIHAYGHCVVITGKSVDGTDRYTFLATVPILKYILDDMNQKIVVGSLSRLQFSSVMSALENIECNFQLRSINKKWFLIPEAKDMDPQTNKTKKL